MSRESLKDLAGIAVGMTILLVCIGVISLLGQ
jgi:hypothetical protein